MTAILLSAGVVAVAAGCGSANASKTVGAGTNPTTTPSTAASAAPTSITAPAPTTSTTTPATSTTICPLSVTPGTPGTVPVDEVCSATGAPHFGSPDAAMDYLATAWNSDNVQEIDYVTDPAGRQQLDSMATLMVNLQFKSCTENPAGDYTCYFTHDITPSTSPTTYPNPGGYPPGEAVFTVAPADAPGWYLTEVVHCG
jgi:hypothetical protein